ncbi:hopanoid-associated sugar epimerase [Synechococcus sp. PCC 7502]|uniref:hopanoid-associated sugar epimerase n=1 Tax=Synechococcus sp. PCC 7502 TaxID=1173263 RepID=UPI00029F8DDE|nr:hopanoid-associated sugar epimerase [Synechococcus sp. PCC 7502]AFY74034.1 hopanoid-associated sugar epimerase [Synechococcus sp. PCC 7502]
MAKTAFVTGGTGFVGANLIRSLLEQNYQVKALVRSQSPKSNLDNLDIQIISSDLNDPQLWTHLQNCDVLFHVAAHYSLWQKDKDLLYQNNVLGTRNILEAARKAEVPRTIYTSSVAAIGVKANGEPADETYQSPMEKLVGNYKKSKYLAEQEAHKAVQAGQDIVIVNPSTPIGGYDIKPTPTGDIILRFLRRQMPAYLDTGLNFINVKDVAIGHILAYEKGITGDRYILGHQNLTLKFILDQLAQITGLPAPQVQVPYWLPFSVAWIDEKVLSLLGKSPSIPIDGVRMSRQVMYYNPAKAIKELGLPQTAIATALTDAVNWFKSNGYV